MLTTIEGTYENGQIILDELPPVQQKTKVVVTFLNEKEGLESTQSNVIRFGSMKGLIRIGEDFNEPLDDLRDYM
jgi:Protein of unknown function (DUF2281)